MKFSHAKLTGRPSLDHTNLHRYLNGIASNDVFHKPSTIFDCNCFREG